MIREEKKYRYKGYTFKLADSTVETLALMRGNMTWNKFFVSIIREKEGIKCYFCHTVGDLELHHIIAVKDGGTDEPDNLVHLCKGCHRKTENWGRKKQLINNANN